MKIKLASGFELSKTYANTKDNYKVVHVGKVLAYVVESGSGSVSPFVIPLYHADVHVKVGDTWHISASYEYGDHFEGVSLAGIAATAIGALEASARAASVPRKA